jgi:hypothetical protein
MCRGYIREYIRRTVTERVNIEEIILLTWLWLAFRSENLVKPPRTALPPSKHKRSSEQSAECRTVYVPHLSVVVHVNRQMDGHVNM